jgi:hypothetical protein
MLIDAVINEPFSRRYHRQQLLDSGAELGPYKMEMNGGLSRQVVSSVRVSFARCGRSKKFSEGERKMLTTSFPFPGCSYESQYLMESVCRFVITRSS